MGKDLAIHCFWRSIVYVTKTETEPFDWFVKADWDTYLFPHHIKHYVTHVRNWSGMDEHHYAGHKDYHKPNKHFISGAMQLLSHKTFYALAQVLDQMPKSDPDHLSRPTGDHACRDGAGLADSPTANCIVMHVPGAQVEETRDELGRERVLLVPPSDLLTFNRTLQGEWWYWAGKPQSVGQMENCCSDFPLAFHGRTYKDAKAGHYYYLEQKLYNRTFANTTFEPQKYRGIHPKNVDVNERYLTKVKRAMELHNFQK